MVGIQRIGGNGEPVGRKRAHTRRGLASNGYRYATIDYPTWRQQTNEAIRKGNVVGIGRAHVIRRRPKVPSPTF